MLQIRFKKNNQTTKQDFYVTGMDYISTQEAWEYFRETKDCKISVIQTERYPNNDPDVSPFLYRMLKIAEPEKGSTDLLNRIIRNGGLSEYVKLLEGR